MLLNTNALLVFVLTTCAAAPGALADYPTSWARADIVDTDVYARSFSGLAPYGDYVRRTAPPPYSRHNLQGHSRQDSPRPPPQYLGGTKPSTRGHGANLPAVKEQSPDGTKPSNRGRSKAPTGERTHHGKRAMRDLGDWDLE
ncbi:uncharacterized protein B0H18DRAFT_424557 [Fomitopsis serialis]|uniref:uncharacterized protein n=1 Tax=Fomitopsis serialis TaxID=139415 RepID=UPI002008AC2C|nr:uncharacterized protein B0H18DRAFT_424557 [Neoantrodia serialis]KAH9924518.1 hypothetical protein B0H18DRAFT_424557 [Neoantrodia serialis]